MLTITAHLVLVLERGERPGGVGDVLGREGAEVRLRMLAQSLHAGAGGLHAQRGVRPREVGLPAHKRV